MAAVAAPSVSVPAGAQAPQIVAHTVDLSSRQASLGLELSDGSAVKISLARGVFQINDKEAGRYSSGGALEESWRALLDEAASLSTAGLRTRMTAWRVNGLAGPELKIKRLIDGAFQKLPSAGTEVLIAPSTREPVGDPGNVDVAAQVGERVARAVAASVAAQATQGRGFDVNIAPASRGVGTVANNIAGLIGMFVALACIAFGLVSFAPRQVEAVADTVHRSFVRSFFAGLFAQPLLLPILGMMTVGLILTIVGIVVVPVALVAFTLAVALGMIGWYVAIARALGEVILRRRGADGDFSLGTTPYRASVVGLAGLLAIWAPFALMSEVPGINWVLLWCAIVFTWVMATAGFGATILSRGGIRHSFVRPLIPVSGEFRITGEVAAARAAVRELE
ncbi:MAG: hypothetical protein EXR93_08495 [Gemmatimonadetes bacterium]|nr:hypothetical protein [Gemmatimonadota bacterium]